MKLVTLTAAACLPTPVVLFQTPIDIVKMDIEGSEWPSLEAMFAENSLKNVKQFVFEVHVTQGRANVRQFTLVHKLETLGFRKFGVRVNHYSRFVTSSGRRLARSYELSYINVEFLRQYLKVYHQDLLV